MLDLMLTKLKHILMLQNNTIKQCFKIQNEERLKTQIYLLKI